jgi:hypothetical protein
VNVDYAGYDESQQNLIELINRTIPNILRVSERALITCGHDNIRYYPKEDWILALINKAGANQNRWGFTCWQPILAYGKDPFRASGQGARPDIIEFSES